MHRAARVPLVRQNPERHLVHMIARRRRDLPDDAALDHPVTQRQPMVQGNIEVEGDLVVQEWHDAFGIIAHRERQKLQNLDLCRRAEGAEFRVTEYVEVEFMPGFHAKGPPSWGCACTETGLTL